MSKSKVNRNGINTDFDPERISNAGPDNDALLDYETERVVRGVAGKDKAAAIAMPAKKDEIRYGKKKDPNRRDHRYHGVGAGILVVILLLLVILACGMCGGSVWAWNEFAYPYVNLTLPEAVELLGELYKVDPGAIVTNPYDPVRDLDSFYVSFKKGLYLDPDTELTLKDIFDVVTSQQGGSGEDGDQTEGESSLEAMLASQDLPGENVEQEGTGSDALDALLQKVQFDFSSLDRTQNSQLEKEVLEISDRELAAVLNEALTLITEVEGAQELVEQIGVQFSDLVRIEQVEISGVENVLNQTNTKLLVTVSLQIGSHIETIANNVLTNVLIPSIQESNPDMAGTVQSVAEKVIPMLPKLLPQQIYFTVAVYPNVENAAAEITYNNLNEEQQALLDKALSGVLLPFNMGGDETAEGDDAAQGEEGSEDTEETVQEYPLPEFINVALNYALDMIGDMVTLSFTNTEEGTGVVQTKPIEIMLTLLGAENITQAQFLAIMRDIEVPYEEMDEIYSDAQYSESTLKLNLNNFIDGDGGFAEKYFFNNTNADGSKVITADNIFTIIDDLMSEENIARITIADAAWNVDDVYNANEYRPVAQYNAIPQLINGYLAENMDGGLGGMPATVLAAQYTDNGTAEGAITLTIKAEIAALVEEQLGGEGSEISPGMQGLIEQLLPPAIYLKVTYSLDGVSGVYIAINNADENYGDGQSSRDFDTIFRLLNIFGASLTMEDGTTITNFMQMCTMINDVISGAFEEVSIKLGGTLQFTEDNVIFPNIFELISVNEQFSYSNSGMTGEMTQEQFEETYALSDSDIYDILCRLYGYEAGEDQVGDDIGEIKSELSDKYYLTLSGTTMDGVFEEIKGLKDTYADKLRMKKASTDTATGLSYMADDDRPLDELRPIISAESLGALIQSSGELNMDEELSVITAVNIMSVKIGLNDDGQNTISMVAAGTVDIDNLTNEDGSPSDAQKFGPLFPENLYILIEIVENVNGDGTVTYSTSYSLNGIDSALMTKTMFFVSKLSGDPSASKESIDKTINNGVNNAFGSISSGGVIDVTFVPDTAGGGNGGIELSTIFTMAVETLWTDEEGNPVEGKPDEEELFRGTIQSLWNSGLTAEEGYAYANGEASLDLEYDDATAPFKIDVSARTVSTQISDAWIASQIDVADLAGSVGISAGSDGSVGMAVYQTYILPRTDHNVDDTTGEEAKAQAIKAAFDGTGVIAQDAGTLLFTLSITTESLMADESSNLSKLVPETVYLSAGIPISEDGLDNVAVTFNTMTTEQIGVLRQIMARGGFSVDQLFDNTTSSADGTSLAEKIADTELVNENVSVTVSSQMISVPVRVTVADLFGLDSQAKYSSEILTDPDNGAGNSGKEHYIYIDYSGGQVGLGYIGYSVSIDDIPGGAGGVTGE